VSFTHDVAADHRVTLADGRALGYSAFGDPDGYPVLNNHGGLLCRFDIELAHADAVRLGVRIISPDRPGVATSEAKDGRDTLDWADDVEELLAFLDIDTFATMGWSMGGQYALAVAHRLGPRVQATAVIAGCLPLDDDIAFAELNEMDQKLTKLSQKHPLLARTEFAALGALERLLPERMTKRSSRTWPDPDREVTETHGDWMAATMVEALHPADGMVGEYTAWARPWRFDPSEISTPVTIWQGTADPLVPSGWGSRLAGAIPGAELREVEGEGHMIAVSRRVEILQALLDHARR
jgi:pimeloyl-ACP methyl ester carboxylesterase